MKSDTNHNENLELAIELTEGMLQEEGFKTLRYSKSDKRWTTAYDGLIFRDANGQEYEILFDISMTSKDGGFNWKSTDYIGESGVSK